jgi:hypothetical protein
MNLSSAVRTAKTVITANSPVLLVGTAVAGIVATGVLAAKGGYKARAILDEAEEEKGDELTVTEKVQLTWLCYAAPAITSASTIACVVGVHTIHNKRHAALAGLYAVTQGKLDDYREKAEELLGAKKTQDLNNAIAQKAVDKNPLKSDSEILIVSDGTELCYDDWSGRYFMGSVNKIEAALNEINRQLVNSGEVSLNTFYDHLGLTNITMGERFGWSGADRIEGRFSPVQTTDGRPAVGFWFQHEPKDNLGLR